MKPLSLLCLVAFMLGLAGCETTHPASPAALAQPAALGASTTSEQPPELLDRKPKMLSAAQPVYPYDLRKAGIEGRVVVEFIVDTHGDVVAPFVVSATHPAFGPPALVAISLCKYSPGIKNGHPVNCRMRQSLTFSLGEAK